MNLDNLETYLNDKLVSRNAPLIDIFNKNSGTEVFNEGYEKSINNFYISKSSRHFIEDYSGNKYIDTSLGTGTHILGHGFIAEAIGDQLKNGSLFTIPSTYPYEIATVINELVGKQTHFVFCNSGAEATTRAVRIARAFTKKKKIALFSGGWHGGNDMLMFDDDQTSNPDSPRAEFRSSGTPEELLGTVLMLPYNSDAAFEIIKANAADIAMVIIEPSQGSNPRADMQEFLAELRQITTKLNILLCFDEIITGFRVQAGGCQEFYNIEADLVTYGKTAGGGLPVGVVAGSATVMKVIKGGEDKPVFMGGTFSANPAVMHAAGAVLKRLNGQKDSVYRELNANGDNLREQVNQFCMEKSIPARMMGIGSMNRILFTDKHVKSRRDRDNLELSQRIQNTFIKFLLLEHGVFINKNRTMFLATTQNAEDVNRIGSAIVESFDHFRANGYL